MQDAVDILLSGTCFWLICLWHALFLQYGVECALFVAFHRLGLSSLPATSLVSLAKIWPLWATPRACICPVPSSAMEGTGETLPRDCLKPSILCGYVGCFGFFWIILMLSCTKMRKCTCIFSFHVLQFEKASPYDRSFFFSGGESQRKKLQALFGPSIQLQHSTLSWKFRNEEISIFDPTKMDLFPKQ